MFELELRTGRSREWLLEGRNLATVVDKLTARQHADTADIVAMIDGMR